jgi:hypothetical protein
MQGEPTMGTSYADNVVNRSGTNDPATAQTQYRAVPSAGHKPVPPHVLAARRRQVLIDGMTGEQAVFDPAERELQYQVRKVQAHASAVNQAIMRSPSNGGSLGGGTVLTRSADRLPWIFFGVGD